MDKKDLTVIKKHWEAIETDSLKDKNLQIVERSAIVDLLNNFKVDTLADIGCGNCEDTVFFSQSAKSVDAFDYSETMIKAANKIICESNAKNIKIAKLDLINDPIINSYDTIITKRALINLGNFENQKKAIVKIHNSLNKNGYYLMLECSVNGLNNMNSIRKSLSLNEIPMPFHNYHFEMDQLLQFLKNYFKIKSVRYFSDYFFLTRIVGPLINKDEPYKYDSLFKELSFMKLIEKQIGPQFLFLLKKK